MTRSELKYYSSLNKKKFRDEEKKFIIEGEHLIEEILKSKYYKNDLTKVFTRNDYENETLLKRIKEFNIEIEKIDSKNFDKISDTKTPQGILGIVKYFEEYPTTKKNDLIVALDNINDPGNLGTIIRTSYWFDVPEIVLSKNSVDIYNSKVIRGSQGAIFNVIIRQNVNLDNYLLEKHNDGWIVFLTDPNAEESISNNGFHSNDKYIFVFGNEANGISQSILSGSNYRKIKINSYSDCESLNVGISVGIILNEARSRMK